MLRATLGLVCIPLFFLTTAILPAQAPKTPRKLPPVDENVPKKYETATLALG